MTLLAPQFLYAAFAVAAAVVALHFLVTRQPRLGVLPTARFVPDRPATAIARAAQPSDLPLMLLRVALVLAAGLGLARPVPTPARRADARVILVDVSRSVRDVDALRDAARRVHREGDAVVMFDSAARLLTGRVGDSLRLLVPTTRTGRLSAALIEAMRAASALGARADSIGLVIVSPLDSEEADAATTSIRALWPGRATLRRAGSGAPASATRATLLWAPTTRPRGALARARPDTIGGVVAGEATVVAPFARAWRYPRDSLRGATVIARWVDGEPAAVEWANAAGCIRSISIQAPAAGDLVLRSDFAALVARLNSACPGAQPVVPIAESMVASLTGAGGYASRRAFAPHLDARSTLAPWLFGLAIALALAELLVRTRRRNSTAVAHERAHDVAA
jgi:hypothetical protein